MFRNYSFDKKADKHSFDMNEVDLSIINGIRRTILTDIPVVGFMGEDEPTVDIIYNNGPLHNEILIHRIGLIPLHLSDEITETYDNDMEFELNVENNGNENFNNNETNGTRKTKKKVCPLPGEEKRDCPKSGLWPGSPIGP